MATIIIMLGPGAICPTLYMWISCGNVIHLCTSTVRIFISGKAAMPPANREQREIGEDANQCRYLVHFNGLASSLVPGR